MVSTFEFSGNIVGIMIKSEMDDSAFDKMHEMRNSKLNDYEKINLYVELEESNNISFTPLIKHFGFQLEHAKRFSKIGVVTEKQWLKNVMEIKDLLMDAEVKVFSHQERMLAIQWIAE